MISPVLEEGATIVKPLFPPGSWYCLFDITEVLLINGRKSVTLDAPLNVINVHLYQTPLFQCSKVIDIKLGEDDSLSSRHEFPSWASDGDAKENIFVDDDELTKMKLENGTSTYIEFSAILKENVIRVWSDVQEGDFALNKGWIIEQVSVLGLGAGAAGSISVEVYGKEVKGDFGVEAIEQHYHHDSDTDGSLKTWWCISAGCLCLLGRIFPLLGKGMYKFG